MAGSRWFARNALTSMGWWCLIIFAIAGCRRVLAADSAAMEPIAAVARGEEGGCSRPLSDVIWGFLVTLLAFTLSLWGSWKYKSDDASTACMMILAGVLDPLVDLFQIVDSSLWCVSLLWACHKMEYPNSHITSCSWLKFLCSSLLPWSKSLVRILVSCEIVVYVPVKSPLLEKIWLWSVCQVKDESEALVVGENWAREIQDDEYGRLQLSREGVGLLVWKGVFCGAEGSKCLPKYDELKYLRGNSGFAILAIAVQALGYIYAVGFRVVKNLRISPLEVIGLVFNIILLMKVFFYSTCNRCHRPLVIYIDEDWEHEIREVNDNDKKKFEHYGSSKIRAIIFFGVFIGLNTLLIYCIVNVIKATNVMVGVSIILFLPGLWLEFLGFILLTDFGRETPSRHEDDDLDFRPFTVTFGYVVLAVVYIWALVGTVLYWRTMHFNTQADLINLSQIIPFIG